jgi:hypothetical protein
MERIIIEGGVVSLQNVQEEKTVGVDDFKEQFRKIVGIETPILPKNCVYYAMKDNRQIILIEKEPAALPIEYNNIQFELGLPFHYFLIQFTGFAFEELRFFFRNSVLSGIEDELLVPPIRNLGADCAVCLGNQFRFAVHGTLQNKVSRVLAYFRESKYNEDLSANYFDHMPDEIRSRTQNPAEYFSIWEEITKQGRNPCEIKWHKFGQNLKETLDEPFAE